MIELKLTVSSGKVATLKHKVFDHTVKYWISISIWFGLSRKLTEIFYSLGDGFSEKTNFNWSDSFTPDCYVKFNLMSNFWPIPFRFCLRG